MPGKVGVLEAARPVGTRGGPPGKEKDCDGCAAEALEKDTAVAGAKEERDGAGNGAEWRSFWSRSHRSMMPSAMSFERRVPSRVTYRNSPPRRTKLAPRSSGGRSSPFPRVSMTSSTNAGADNTGAEGAPKSLGSTAAWLWGLA
jgi:hypothetical protein